MSGRRAKDERKIAGDAKRGALEAAQPVFEALNENEKSTRARVELLEQWAAKFSNANLWRRLRWLFTGR